MIDISTKECLKNVQVYKKSPDNDYIELFLVFENTANMKYNFLKHDKKFTNLLHIYNQNRIIHCLVEGSVSP